ncbi:PIR protein CIR protein [Plasmodium vinckei vinckei]|uniref:PIR protein CIR protein n=1 Tax=Plasmodium vinckei vinckei TaxID=54757 RepID=A0A449BNA3_PLAVN|nr:PIR protein CIR protein [Plasmodium vinckei vinckei]VEV54903.1 PIR protein CIR protein [Plasmodium vinckei vinckei]
MAEKACKFLLDTDKYFTNEIVDVIKFDKSNLFKYKCPYDKETKEYPGCKNNNERINALGGHLYKNLSSISKDFKGKGDNGNRHIEIFIMWLGNKLYNLENNYTVTLEESYKKHLEKYMPNFNYWTIIDSKKEYKRANVWYMSELYKLLNCICNIVIEYNKNNSNNKNKTKIENYSSQCYEKFKNVYNNVKDCYSYFHLLKFLKSIYDDIRNDAIKDADDKKDAIKQAFITNNSFKKAASYHKNNLGDVFEKILNASTISLIDLTTSDWDQMFLNVSDKILDFHTQLCINSYSELVKKQKELESKNQLKVQPQTESDKSGKEANQNSPEGLKDEKPEQFDKTQQPPSEGKKTHGQSEPVKPPIPSQPQAQIQQLGSPPVPLLPQEKDSSSSQKDSSLPKSQTGDSDNGKENTGRANGNKRDPRDPTPNDPAPSDPSSNTPGEYFYWWSSFNGFLFDRTEIFNKASQFIDKSRQTVKEVTDKINSAYTSAVDNLKSAYTVSNNYISGVVNSVTTKLNPFSTFQLGDNKSEPGYPVNGGNEPNPLQSILPPDSPLPKSPDSQGSSTQIHKCPVHQIAPTDGNMGSQTPPSGQGALSISGSNPSNTKKENVITMANVKIKEAPSIWCIRPNTKCDITGISIIGISIFVFLVIMYKYLSLGCTSKSKRKKNIKKVINSIGGKRPVQIIIKSYDRNKDLKPVINSVGRKKYPLLNIYKLMQADPVPFVNLFFLLIFFVYKKKLNYLEL